MFDRIGSNFFLSESSRGGAGWKENLTSVRDHFWRQNREILNFPHQSTILIGSSSFYAEPELIWMSLGYVVALIKL